MTTKPLTDRLAEITRKLTESMARQADGERANEPAPRATGALRAEAAAHEMPAASRVPAPPASPLIHSHIRILIQEEARLHWHHRDLPVSRFSACMLLPG
ncbi:MAG TPA: hypothetical protein VL860_03840 [Planctomycetota bacterium]|nr:hypothetical protein [Planctomycetota bacterium]